MKKFQLTRLVRGVTSLMPFNTPSIVFQLTRLVRGVTFWRQRIFCIKNNFNSHAS